MERITKKRKKHAPRQSITRRWLVNSLSVILFVLIVLEVAVAVAARGYFDSMVEQSVYAQLRTMNQQLLQVTADPERFAEEVRLLVTGFTERERMECVTVDDRKTIVDSSSGFRPEGAIEMPDVDAAMGAEDGYGVYRGKLEGTGESYFAMSMRLPSVAAVNQPYRAIRIMVSLDRINSQILGITIIFTLVGIAILVFVILSGSYFVNSIVIPVGEIGRTARKIAAGDFDARLTKKREDEIGDLCDTINDMAQELQNSENLKNEFISSVSHELRTPLTAIRGWGETITSVAGSDGDEEVIQKGMNVILGEADRLSGMVEELLDFSNMQQGRTKLTFATIDVAAEVEDVVIMYEERAKKEGVALTCDCPQTPVMIDGDRNRLRQVFVNIVDNALKYTPPGGRITAVLEEEFDGVLIRIADTGSGIKKQDLSKVKERFYKANNKKRGSGIGLAVTDEIVRLHGGFVQIESVEDEGTTVTVFLPRRQGVGGYEQPGDVQ